MLLRFTSLILISLLFWACSAETPTIDNSVNFNSALVAVGETNSVLQIANLGTSAISDADVLTTKSLPALSGMVTKIKRFKENFYLVFSEEKKIEIRNNITFELVETVDFSEFGKPLDIIFTNPTDAFVNIENESKLILFDSFYKNIAREVETAVPASAMTYWNGLLYIISTNDNMLYAYRTNDFKESFSATTPPVPLFCEVSPQDEVIVISAGAGKMDSNTPSPVYATFYEAMNGKVNLVLELDDRRIPTLESTPLAFAISPRNFGFIAFDKGLTRFNTITKSEYRYISPFIYSNFVYVASSNSFLMLKKDANNAALGLGDYNVMRESKTINLNQKITAFQPL